MLSPLETRTDIQAGASLLCAVTSFRYTAVDVFQNAAKRDSFSRGCWNTGACLSRFWRGLEQTDIKRVYSGTGVMRHERKDSPSGCEGTRYVNASHYFGQVVSAGRLLKSAASVSFSDRGRICFPHVVVFDTSSATSIWPRTRRAPTLCATFCKKKTEFLMANRFNTVLCCLVLALCALPAIPGWAAQTIHYPRHQSGATLHTDYYFEVLQMALQHTTEEFGPVTLKYTDQGMSPARAAAELASGSGLIQVDVRSWNEERGRTLLQVPLPVDRGLIGYRVLLVRAQDLPKFAAVRSLSDLRRFTYGLLGAWGDVRVFEHNGLPVVRGDNYEGLFRMLVAGRFDAFSRDIDEIQFEFERYAPELPGLAIEETLLLRYRSARYFFVSRTEEGARLAIRIAAGLKRMQQDGSLDELFLRHKRGVLERLNVKGRRVIALDHPQLPPGAAEIPAELLPPAALRRREAR